MSNGVTITIAVAGSDAGPESRTSVGAPAVEGPMPVPMTLSHLQDAAEPPTPMSLSQLQAALTATLAGRELPVPLPLDQLRAVAAGSGVGGGGSPAEQMPVPLPVEELQEHAKSRPRREPRAGASSGLA